MGRPTGPPGRFGDSGNDSGCRHRSETVAPAGKWSRIFSSWFRHLPPAARCSRDSRRATDRRRLKEKDKNMNGPARITALAVALVGMVISMSGCDKLAARAELNKGVDAYKGTQIGRAACRESAE